MRSRKCGRWLRRRRCQRCGQTWTEEGRCCLTWLTEEVFVLCARVVAAIEQSHNERTDREVKKLLDLETTMNKNAELIREKKQSLTELKKNIRTAIKEIEKMNSLMENAEEYSSLFNEKTISKLISTNKVLEDRRIRKEAKKLAIEECILQLKHIYESKHISFRELMEKTRPLFCKQFRSIYAISKISLKLNAQY
eukprot:TRINITY_DN8559_c0_g1_i3.p1 TRINITY_DN8559_c0_g1~~TRINITY_DN8559_c0_g1_i3.p1  ORF type:complete len:195 (-),score=20.57 TRINITY_DN8559_c0_g1_i3:527-1111(-)